MGPLTSSAEPIMPRTRILIATTLLLLLVVAAGLAYWLKKPGAADDGANPGMDAESAITEERGRNVLHEMLAKADIIADVNRFQMKALRWFTVREDIDPRTGGLVRLKSPFRRIAIVYEADVVFQMDCQLQEQPHLVWSPGHDIGTGMSSVVNGQQLPFRKGHRQAVRGVLFVRLEHESWALDCALRTVGKS